MNAILRIIGCLLITGKTSLQTSYPQARNLCRIPGTDDLWVACYSEAADHVYAVFSPDGGMTHQEWCLDWMHGRFPTIGLAPILADTLGGLQGGELPWAWTPVVVWPGIGTWERDFLCARYYLGQWQYAWLYDDFDRLTLHYPSMVIGLKNKAHVTWEAVDDWGGTGDHYVYYGTFQADEWPPQMVLPVEQIDFVRGPGVDWTMAPCIHIDNAGGYERPHIVYKWEDGIYYTEKMTGGGWTTPELISDPAFVSSFPFLESYGGNMKALWHGNNGGPDDVWYCWKPVTWPSWWGPYPVSGTPTESRFPSMSAAYASWSEELQTDWDILMRKEPFQDPWVNITNSPDVRSMYSHLNYWNRFSEPNYLYLAWTEASSWVEILEYPVYSTNVHYYCAETGQKEPSFYCVQRDSFIQFGPEAYKQVDIDHSQTVYRFRGLKPWMYYLMTVTGFWDGVSQVEQRVYIDGIEQGPLNLTPGGPETLTVWVPTETYEEDDEVYVATAKVSGPWAVTGPITIYQFEEQEGREGGFQAASASPVEQREFVLVQNYPNPVRNRTAIAYQLPADSRVSLKVYDICGRLVRTLADGTEQAGHHEASWDGRDEAGRPVSSGVYFYSLCATTHGGQAASFTRTRKMTVLR